MAVTQKTRRRQPQSTAVESSYEALLALSVEQFPPEKFTHLADVIIFAEHSTSLRDGRPVVYTAEALRRIAESCNRRIAQTGNWAAVCIGHTDDQDRAKPLIGFAGPFRLQQLDGRTVITADLWLHRDQADQLRYYPRPSPEVWIPTDGFDPDRVFLDPIAFLGADAPRLDLGMTFLYRAQADGQWLCEKYAAVFPGPTSVVVPSPVGEPEDETSKYEKGEGMITAEDIQAILKAIEATDWYQWLRRQMAAGEAAEQPAAEKQTQTYQPADEDAQAKQDKAPDDKEEYRCKESYQLRQRELEGQVQQLQQALAEERARRVNTDRRRRLEQLARQYAIQVDEEMDLCQYGRMDDTAYERHLERIERYYRPIPADTVLPAWAEADAEAAGPVSREMYQRRRELEVSSKAAELVRRLANRGQWISYDEAVERVKKEQSN